MMRKFANFIGNSFRLHGKYAASIRSAAPNSTSKLHFLLSIIVFICLGMRSIRRIVPVATGRTEQP